MRNIKSVLAGAVLAASLLCHGSAGAGVIIGGSALLAGGDVSQLESWLGEGPITLNNIFTKGGDGTNAMQWHAAVDGMGPTFSILRIVDNLGVTSVVGGYNPQSWNSSESYNFTPADADRTAFIFNLTTGTIARQCRTTDDPSCGLDGDNSAGRFQTYNRLYFGPTFGAGHDFWVNVQLDSGFSSIYSYGNPAGDSYAFNNSPIDSDPASSSFSVIALETFTVVTGPETVPAPGTLALFGIGLAGISFARRRRAA